jgi:TPP-dependent pyruvate/acetoin dehydrogenase alpha subunit
MTEGPFLDPSEMFDDVYADLPDHLRLQRREMRELEEG